MTIRCPICKKEVARDAPDFPFCSERCRILDLGNWASEKYKVPSSEKPETPREEDE
jgi:uncharacterized protein